jgi:hypothetical protein
MRSIAWLAVLATAAGAASVICAVLDVDLDVVLAVGALAIVLAILSLRE